MIKAGKLAPPEQDSNSSKSIALFAGLLLLASVSQSATAAAMDEGLYYGAQIAQFSYEQDNVPDLDITALVGRLGYMFNQNFGVEGRLGGGIGEDDSDFNFTVNKVTDSNANWKVKIESFVGVYGVARYDVTESFGVYGLAGGTNMSVKRTLKSQFTSGSGSESDSSFSIGAGLDYGFTDKFRVNLEAMSYMDKSDYTATAVSLGVQF
jgi:opacity protein-like surface antigen